MSFEKQRIESVRAEVKTSTLRPSHRADIDDMLVRVGEATNGVQDKIQAVADGMAALGVCFARDAIYRPADIEELLSKALKTHTEECLDLRDGMGPWDGRERRGRDGRDGRDSITATTKAGRFTAPAGTVRLVAILAFIMTLAILGAKGAKWI